MKEFETAEDYFFNPVLIKGEAFKLQNIKYAAMEAVVKRICPKYNYDIDSVRLEYKALRDELLKRIDLRQQVVSRTLTIAGLLLAYSLSQRFALINGVGGNTFVVALVYPPIAAFLALSWAQLDNRIRDLSTYIRCCIESTIPSLGWEDFIQTKRESRQAKWGRLGATWLSHGGVFIWTQLIALYIGLDLKIFVNVSNNLFTLGLVFVDIISIFFVLWIVHQVSQNISSTKSTLRSLASDPSWLP
jgi:hypothetical protein